jgi:hypothetical protein
MVHHAPDPAGEAGGGAGLSKQGRFTKRRRGEEKEAALFGKKRAKTFIQGFARGGAREAQLKIFCFFCSQKEDSSPLPSLRLYVSTSLCESSLLA